MAGPSAKGLLWSPRATSLIHAGWLSYATSWCPRETASMPCARILPRRWTPKFRLPVARRCVSCCRSRSAASTAAAIACARCTISSTPPISSPRRACRRAWPASATSNPTGARFSASIRAISLRLLSNPRRMPFSSLRTSGHPGSRPWARSQASIRSKTASLISRITSSQSKPVSRRTRP